MSSDLNPESFADIMTIGLISNAFLDFLLSKFGEEGLASILEEAGLPPNATFMSSCPYADTMLTRCATEMVLG